LLGQLLLSLFLWLILPDVQAVGKNGQKSAGKNAKISEKYGHTKIKPVLEYQ
jgi:hypothetical protein